MVVGIGELLVSIFSVTLGIFATLYVAVFWLTFTMSGDKKDSKEVNKSVNSASGARKNKNMAAKDKTDHTLTRDMQAPVLFLKKKMKICWLFCWK